MKKYEQLELDDFDKKSCYAFRVTEICPGLNQGNSFSVDQKILKVKKEEVNEKRDESSI